MTRVDFYLLQIDSEQKLLDTVCLLIEKARAADQSVYVHTRSAEHADQLDAALWQYRSVSFIPHLNLGSSILPGTQPQPSSDLTSTSLDSTMVAEPKLAGWTAGNETETRVTIGYCHEPAGQRDVLINLCKTVPAFFSRFRRTLEVVGGSETERNVSRQRYRFYKSRGYPLNHHNLS